MKRNIWQRNKGTLCPHLTLTADTEEMSNYWIKRAEALELEREILLKKGVEDKHRTLSARPARD